MRRETVVRCSVEGCEEPASHKIAAPWADGRFTELKCYGFACPEHVEAVYRDAEGRWLEYEPVRGESIHEVGIFRYQPGVGDRHLERDRDLEENIKS